jgi:hypothetical protein
MSLEDEINTEAWALKQTARQLARTIEDMEYHDRDRERRMLKIIAERLENQADRLSRVNEQPDKVETCKCNSSQYNVTPGTLKEKWPPGAYERIYGGKDDR